MTCSVSNGNIFSNEGAKNHFKVILLDYYFFED